MLSIAGNCEVQPPPTAYCSEQYHENLWVQCTSNELDMLVISVRCWARTGDFSLLQHVQTNSEDYITSHTESQGGSFPWDRNGRDFKLTTHLHLGQD